MKTTYDPAKRERTLRDRDLDFEEGAEVKKRAMGGDLAKIDAHEITPEEYEEIPELTEEDFARGEWHVGRVPVRRGRPRAESPKQAISVRLDPDVLAHFRSTGRGWQGRINQALRKAAKLKAKARQPVKAPGTSK